MTDESDRLRARLRADLTAAIKARDKVAVAVLRTTLAAFDNAEAVPSSSPATGPAATSAHVAGTSLGLGSTEVARRVLGLDDLHTILRAQIGELTAGAHTYDGHGQSDAAARLRREADTLQPYLPD